MMPLDFVAATGAMTMTDPSDGHVIWSNTGKLVNLIPSAAISLTAVVVSFPDLLKANAYYFEFGSPFGFDQDVCDSFITWLPQEWGPGRANDLAATALGTVPAGTDYLDVRAQLTRTSAPSQIFGTDIPVLAQEGQWIALPGGSCPLETTGDFSRGFEVVMSGTSVVLNRYQSVRNLASVPWRTDQHAGSTDNGWTHGAAGSTAPAAVGAISEKGILVSRRDSKSSGTSVTKNRTGSNPCSVADNTNYGATYSVNLLITPGRYQS